MQTSQGDNKIGEKFLDLLNSEDDWCRWLSAQDPRPSFGKSNGTPKSRTELNPLATNGTRCPSNRFTPKRLTPGIAPIDCSASGSSTMKSGYIKLSGPTVVSVACHALNVGLAYPLCSI